jgi:DNA-binding response OmpR family regulator
MREGRILVVEDNYLLAEVICDFIAECGLGFAGPSGDIDDATRLAREEAIDGAVLDINLRGRLCFPVCNILVKRRIPFVFLTGYTQLALIPNEFRSAPLICKPFDPDEMKTALDDMLDAGGRRGFRQVAS